MTSTRVTTALSFVVGTAGVAVVATANSVLIAVIGSAMFMGALIALIRHFWRERERGRHQSDAKRTAELSTSIADLRGEHVRMEEAVRAGVDQVSTRIDGFARGILEYVAQIELEIQEANTAQAESLQLVDRHSTKHRDQLMTQLDGVIGVYLTLKPRVPYPTFGGWAIGGDCARRLVSLILTHPPSWIIDVGSGLSTLVAAQALETAGSDGRVLSLEHDKAWMDRTIELITQHEVLHRVALVHAPLIDVDIEGETFTWYDLSQADLPDQVDLIFIDGPPKATGPLARYPAIPLLLDRLSPTGVVLMDDAYRPDERKAIKRWEEENPGLKVSLHSDSKGTVEIRRQSQ